MSLYLYFIALDFLYVAEFFCDRMWCGASCAKTLQDCTAYARHTTRVFCVVPLWQQVVADAPEEQPQSLRCMLCAKHRDATARITPFKIKCAKYSFTEGSIHHLDYDEDVFTCIQTKFNRGLKSVWDLIASSLCLYIWLSLLGHVWCRSKQK